LDPQLAVINRALRKGENDLKMNASTTPGPEHDGPGSFPETQKSHLISADKDT